MTEDNSKKDEYLDVSHNMRTYINMRFAKRYLWERQWVIAGYLYCSKIWWFTFCFHFFDYGNTSSRFFPPL